MNYELSGKTVVVTGATSGIGLAVVRKFTQHGAFVIGVGRSETRNQDGNQKVRQFTFCATWLINNK